MSVGELEQHLASSGNRSIPNKRCIHYTGVYLLLRDRRGHDGEDVGRRPTVPGNDGIFTFERVCRGIDSEVLPSYGKKEERTEKRKSNRWW